MRGSMDENRIQGADVGRACFALRSPYPSSTEGVDPAIARRRRLDLPQEICPVSWEATTGAPARGLERRAEVSRGRSSRQNRRRLNHDKLMGRIAQRVGDRRVLRLLRAFLTAGVMEHGLESPSVEGTPQGGPLSPLLSNLVLDELDRELEARGHRFVRYADDCNIYVRSERAGQRVMESVKRFLTGRLKLKVNESKSAVARPQERKFLGFSFTEGPVPKRKIAPKAVERFRERVRKITRGAKGKCMERMLEELGHYVRGWRSYFGFCETPSILRRLDGWVRRRVRNAFWRQWKTGRKRFRELVKRGVDRRQAANTAGSRCGAWRVSHTPALTGALSNAALAGMGLPSLAVGR